MAEAVIIGVVVENLFNQAFSLAADEITLSVGCETSLQNLAGELEIIQALIVDADKRNIQSMPMKTWFERLKAVMFDAENVLEEYNYEILRQKIPQRKRDKVLNFFSPVKKLVFHSKIAHKVEAIISRLKSVKEQGNLCGLISRSSEVQMDRIMTGPFIQEEEIIGRDDDVKKVVDMLVNANGEENISLTAIVGMGGQGKTTIAQLVYKHNRVVSYFEKILWVCVSDDFKIERLLNEMLQSVTHQNLNLTTREALVGKLQENLKGKRYLVIFDDVWNEDEQKWEQLKRDLLAISGSRGTKILVTTRSEHVLSIIRASQTHTQTHVLSKLSEDDSLFLFKKRAFAEGGVEETPQFVAISQRMLKKCCGVPLAIKVLGGLLYSKRDIGEWLSIENSDIWSSINNQGVMSCIKLSYDHLFSLSLKQCFAYCSIFPKDAKMKRDDLIQQWMAQGFLNPPKGSNVQMEDLGRDYFDALLWNSLLQELTYKEKTNTWSCKMHDIVHDFAMHISKDYCFTIEAGHDVNKIGEVVHVSLKPEMVPREKIDIPQVISSKIRTLYLPGGLKYFNKNVVLNFGCLRTLKLSGYNVKELPTSIGRMKLIRYIDVADTDVEKLPTSYIKLYNLQSLILPEKFKQKVLYVGTLVNLRHIYFRKLDDSFIRYTSVPECLIMGIKELVHLQTLSHFIVSHKKGCKIDELEKLDNLRGRLRIYGLDKVMNGEEAKKANISRKLNIDHLHLEWNTWRDRTTDEEDVMEGLIPHSYLKRLTIIYFNGLRFPSWMTMTDNRLLNNLIEIKLKGCLYLTQLPTLGHLPLLKKVSIKRLTNVKRIGAEFYSCTDDHNRTSCAFPALEELKIKLMNNLEEWSEVKHPSASVQAFPNLRSLSFNYCDKLSDLPSLTGLTSLTELYIFGIEKLTELPSLQGFTSLTELHISGNEKLTELPSFQGLSSLTKLSIQINERFTALPSLQGLTSLTDLSIKGNVKLSTMPIDDFGLEHLPNLTTLKLDGYFPWPHHNEDDQLYFCSLKTLVLYGNSDNNTSLPEQIQYLPSLTFLSIWHFDGLEALPEWLGNIHSLYTLGLWYNKNIKYMPSVEAMQRLTNLQLLNIVDCPHLEKRCTRGSGPEWHKISHIPHVYGNV